MITLITDASYGGFRVAGWAAWAKCDDCPSRHDSGPVADYEVCSPHEAELAALHRGLVMAWDTWPGVSVLAQCDNERPLRLLRCELGCAESPHKSGISVGCAPLKISSSVERDLLDRISALAARQSGASIIVRHVKGHVGEKHQNGRFWVNGLCDRLAKREMRRLRRAQIEVNRAEAALASTLSPR